MATVYVRRVLFYEVVPHNRSVFVPFCLSQWDFLLFAVWFDLFWCFFRVNVAGYKCIMRIFLKLQIICVCIHILQRLQHFHQRTIQHQVQVSVRQMNLRQARQMNQQTIQLTIQLTIPHGIQHASHQAR